MNRTHVLAVAALALALQGCSTFYAEAEQPSVCLTLTPQSFPIQGGGVTPPATVTAPYDGSLDLNLKDFIPDFLLNGPSQDRILHFLSFRVMSNRDGGNYDFVDSLQLVAVGAPGSTPLVLGSYLRGAAVGVTSISLRPLDPNTNLADRLASGGLTLRVTGNATFPAGVQIPADWSAQVETCLSAKVHKTLQQIIDGT
jgi:hypothetical protein